MKYEFHRVKCHPSLDLSGWYLVITHDNDELLEQVHRSVACTMFMKYGRDPHLRDTRNVGLYNPVRMAAGWIQSALDGLYKHGLIYVNQNHGLMFGEATVLETCIRDVLRFPDSDEHKEGVKITISMWGAGQHYYLRSNKGTLFSQPKFDTYEMAHYEAKQYAFEGNINFEFADRYVYAHEGD